MWAARAAESSPEVRRLSVPPPKDHLDPRARTVWRLSNLLSLLPLGALLAAGTVVLGWTELVPLPLAVAGAIALAAVAVTAALVGPGLTWRHWRYEVGEDEVDLERGVVTRTRTRIPMARIQHVDTRRGPIERRFGLASVVLHTAAGANEIPALAADVADAVRDRIAALANTREDL